MTIDEAIKHRHSVRAYKNMPLTDNDVKLLEGKIEELNAMGHLHMQLIQNEPKAFLGMLAKYGKFRTLTTISLWQERRQMTLMSVSAIMVNNWCRQRRWRDEYLLGRIEL